jgi:hypothetical protein
MLSSHRRYLATEQNNNAKTEINDKKESQPEIGPSAPELQVNNLTGEHESKLGYVHFFVRALIIFPNRYSGNCS